MYKLLPGQRKRALGQMLRQTTPQIQQQQQKKGRRAKNVVGFVECKDCRWGLADESHVYVARFPCYHLTFPQEQKQRKKKILNFKQSAY